ncbi:hypothetical protein [Fibrella forsythiae]|uniref:Uncharacterized protein n=1 Tax=Fibrella forsythiae TaxID=2817061 RepID=A0ABS3JC37_9BACT|nr:hypothetical protein [Fibrella forsythiae]MBO0947556.1 hypothetical protein [Fibrella forsythiae]
MIRWLLQGKAGDMGAALSLSKYATSLTPAMAMHPANKQLSVLRKEDEAKYLKVIATLLMRTAELLNVSAANSLSTIQTADLAIRIGKSYYYLRLEELVYVFNRAQNGVYGKDYNRLDAPTVMGWLDRYDIDERTPLVLSMNQVAAAKLENPDMQPDERAKREYLERARAAGHNVPDYDQLTAEQHGQLEKYTSVRELYDRVAAGKKTEVSQSESERWANRVPKTVQEQFAEARTRWVQEKKEGIVADYAQANSTDTDFEEINEQ